MNENFKLEILYRVSQAMAHHHDVASMLQEILDILASEFDFQRGTITLYLPDENNLRIIASLGLSGKEVERGTYELGEGITGQVAMTREPRCISRIGDEPGFLSRTKAKRDVNRAFICVPIIRQESLIGTLSIDRPPAEEEDLKNDLAFLKIVANILGEAVNSLQMQIEERDTLIRENRMLREELGQQYRPSNIIGNCAVMRQVYNQISQVADSPATVLIRGESGTGKELVARALHYGSSRKNGPFVCVNIAALPENLIESELFGHEKGSFTGAMQQRIGRFEQANGGTLFLDEIGDICPAFQVQLLRVLQERTFQRVGGNEDVTVNVRLIAATSQNLEKLIEQGTFREDLYYRLNVFPIHLPALRERRTDITLLADFFLQKYCKFYNKAIRRISTPAINMMMAYHWPGNVRELENCLERAVLTTNDDVIHGFNLPPSLQTGRETRTELVPERGADLQTMVDSFEREILIDALKSHRGNCAAAARAMGTTQRIFNYRTKKLGIDPRNYKM
jgi:Nif-specific regulatory protein